MQPITISRSARTALKRLVGKSHMLLVNTNGDITNFQAYIQLDPTAPTGTWHSLRSSEITTLMTADELIPTETGISIRTGVRTIELNTIPPEDDYDHITMDPKATRVTINSEDGQNRAALKVLAATASKDDSIPVLTALHIDGNTADERNTSNVSTNRYAVTGETTDRYRATLATLEASPADVDATLPGFLLQELARRAQWELTATNTTTTVHFRDVGLTVTTSNLDDLSYPKIRALFPPDNQNDNSICARPKDIVDVINSLAVQKNEPAVLTHDGTMYATDTPEVPIPNASAILNNDASEIIGFNPNLVTSQFKAIGAKWDDVFISWNKAFKPMSLDYGSGIIGVVMPLRHTPERPMSATEQAKEPVA